MVQAHAVVNLVAGLAPKEAVREDLAASKADLVVKAHSVVAKEVLVDKADRLLLLHVEAKEVLAEVCKAVRVAVAD